jgi:hypothetical protein
MAGIETVFNFFIQALLCALVMSVPLYYLFVALKVIPKPTWRNHD